MAVLSPKGYLRDARCKKLEVGKSAVLGGRSALGAADGYRLVIVVAGAAGLAQMGADVAGDSRQRLRARMTSSALVVFPLGDQPGVFPGRPGTPRHCSTQWRRDAVEEAKSRFDLGQAVGGGSASCSAGCRAPRQRPVPGWPASVAGQIVQAGAPRLRIPVSSSSRYCRSRE